MKRREAAESTEPWAPSCASGSGEERPKGPRRKPCAGSERCAPSSHGLAAAREFEGLVQLASNGVNVSGNSGHCHYDTTEIIAIVLGFLLFIIPGIILLIVFC